MKGINKHEAVSKAFHDLQFTICFPAYGECIYNIFNKTSP
jgi:hypothetical protein